MSYSKLIAIRSLDGKYNRVLKKGKIYKFSSDYNFTEGPKGEVVSITKNSNPVKEGCNLSLFRSVSKYKIYYPVKL